MGAAAYFTIHIVTW